MSRLLVTSHVMAALDSLIPIPQPPEHLYGLLGNIPDFDTRRMTVSLGRLVAKYGPIFRLNVLSKYIIVVCSQELVNEICDEKRFGKKLAILKEIGLALHDGMITADTTDHVSYTRQISATRHPVILIEAVHANRTGNLHTSF